MVKIKRLAAHGRSDLEKKRPSQWVLFSEEGIDPKEYTHKPLLQGCPFYLYLGAGPRTIFPIRNRAESKELQGDGSQLEGHA